MSKSATVFLGIAATFGFTAIAVLRADDLGTPDVLDVGSRRQLFVGPHLIESMDGVRQVLHRPVPREVAIKPEHPWETHGVSYMVTFKDGDRFRAWYRVDAVEFGKGQRKSMTAYAESKDGIHWHKSKLGIIEFDGSKDNNLVWKGPGNNLAAFKDGNPDTPPEERYKALLAKGIHGLVSPDGLRWRLVQDEPILSPGPFDSHNIAFWDGVTEQYVAYTRGVRRDGELGQAMLGEFQGGVRWVRRATSPDFVNWSRLEPIETGGAPREEFYMSLYCMQNWRLPSVHIRRYTLRPDGFVSIQAGYEGGTLVTKPIRFAGTELRLNFSTSAVGWLKVELLDPTGKPITGLTLADCPEIYGDKLDAPVSWTGGGDVRSVTGKTIRLRFQMSDADLYAFQFVTKEST